jgi:uncharacterized protein
VQLFVQGPVGRLEAILWRPEGEPRAAAVVCHPHPAHGGTMHNNVVFRTARGLQNAGLAVLRFNFRGVEASEGAHDGRGAEELDAAAALDHLERELPGLPLWAAGFSFGARTVAALATHDRRVQRLLLVTVPCLAYDCAFVRGVLPPTHAILAGDDAFGNLADLRERVPDLPAHFSAEELPGVDHFFRGKTPELEARVRAWAEGQLEVP